jgi:hypothetical protein
VRYCSRPVQLRSGRNCATAGFAPAVRAYCGLMREHGLGIRSYLARVSAGIGCGCIGSGAGADTLVSPDGIVREFRR